MENYKIRKCKERREQVVAAYRRNQSPDATVHDLVATIGFTSASQAVAELVNGVGNWDGRVSTANRLWAAGISGALSGIEMQENDIYGCVAIHPAHIEQIARSMRQM